MRTQHGKKVPDVKRPLRYLRFLLASTNEHGVHSPFVFSYLTECLYKSPVSKQGKTLDILLKSAAYFEAKRIGVIEADEVFRTELSRRFPQEFPAPPPYDILYGDCATDRGTPTPDEVGDRTHNDSLLLLDNIQIDHTAEARWKTFMQWDHATVTIDFFWCGAVFFRRQQAKEHFRIRI